MSERVKDFMDTLERYEAVLDDAPNEAAARAATQGGKKTREQWIAAQNEARRTSREGTAPKRIFDEDGAAICEAFIERIRGRGFPASTSLENKVVYPNPVRGFLRRAMGKDPVEPFAIRGYRIGTINSSERMVVGGSAQPVFLCEDGGIRVRTATRLHPRYSDDGSFRHQVSDLPLDPTTGELVELSLTAGDDDGSSAWKPASYKNVERMLEHVLNDIYHAELDASFPNALSAPEIPAAA